MVGEYLMFFQINTQSKFTIARNQTLFFHQFYQPKGQWLSGNLGYSSVQALHLRLASCEYARLEYWIFIYLATIRPFHKNFPKTTFSLHLLTL